MSVTESQASSSTLPPRKRAKTQEEKEQRRIERILRNRRAAHASREKKRRHVEFLESHVMDMDSVMNLHKERDLKNELIQIEMMELLEKHGLQKELEALKGKISELPVIPSLKMDTASLLDSNKRSNKKQKATPKPRPIILKNEDDGLYSDEDEDEDEEEEEEDEDESMMDLPHKSDEQDESIMMRKEQSSVYLSPPISNIDSTSPSNLSLELNSKMSDDYYLSNPLFEDLDRQTDDFFSTNLQIKHEDEFLTPNDLVFTSSQQQDINEIQSGLKMMHHPAVVMFKLILCHNYSKGERKNRKRGKPTMFNVCLLYQFLIR